MGAGCNYTNEYYDKNSKKQFVKAVWLEIYPEDNNDYENSISNLFNDLKCILNVRWEDKNCAIQTPLYYIEFESTYNDDGIVITQKNIFDNKHDLDHYEQKLKNIANYNFEKNYYSMINKLCKFGYKFRIATSGYTSGEYNVDSR